MAVGAATGGFAFFGLRSRHRRTKRHSSLKDLQAVLEMDPISSGFTPRVPRAYAHFRHWILGKFTGSGIASMRANLFFARGIAVRRQVVTSSVVPVSKAKQAIAWIEMLLFALAFIAVFTIIVQSNSVQI